MAYSNLIRVAGTHYGNIPAYATRYYTVRRDQAKETNLRVRASETHI